MIANLRKLFHFPEAHFIVLVIVIKDIRSTSSPGLFRARGWHGASLIQSNMYIESKLQIYQLFTTKLNEKRPY